MTNKHFLQSARLSSNTEARSFKHRADENNESELKIRQREVLSELFAYYETAVDDMARLTPRQRQIMELVLAGHPNKSIAAELGISQRTVEHHRALIMKKTGAKSLPGLVRLALAASWKGLVGQSPIETERGETRPANSPNFNGYRRAC